MVRRSVIDELSFSCEGFEFDAELVAQLFRGDYVICEVPIRYAPRGRQEGKKIRFRHGVAWLWQIVKHRFIGSRLW